MRHFKFLMFSNLIIICILPAGESRLTSCHQHRRTGYGKVPQYKDMLGYAHNIVNIWDAPWMVAICFVNSQRKSECNCTGTIVTNNVVITSMSCIMDMPQKIHIMAGMNQLSVEGFKPTIKNVVHHKEFNYVKQHHDFAIIKLKSPLPDYPGIEPIPKVIKRVYNGTHGLVYGWSKRTEPVVFDSLLRAIPVTVIETWYCQLVYGLFFDISNSMFCAELDNAEDSCLVNYGSPLVFKERGKSELVGVAIHGNLFDCCSAFPGIFTVMTPEIIDMFVDEEYA